MVYYQACADLRVAGERTGRQRHHVLSEQLTVARRICTTHVFSRINGAAAA